MLNPAEGYGTFFAALTETEQKRPIQFLLQKVRRFLPAHKPHDQAVTHKRFIAITSKNFLLPVSVNKWKKALFSKFKILPIPPKLHQVPFDQL